MIATIAVGVIIWTLAFVAGWLIAGPIGIVVVISFATVAATLGALEEKGR